MIRFAVLVVFLNFFHSCVSGKNENKYSKSATLEPKAGEVSSSPDSNSPEGTGSVEAQKFQDARVNFIARMSVEPPPELQAEDHDLISTTTSKLSYNSIDRAFLVVAALRLSLMQMEQNKQYQELDLFSGATNTQSKSNSPLSQLAGEYRVSVLEELNGNVLLVSPGIFQIAFAASSNESSEFKTKLGEIVSSKIKVWKRVSNSLGPYLKNSKNSSAVSLANENDVADIRIADLALVEAGRLASIKKYKQAVQLAESVGKKNPLFESSREKIRIFSDQAVLDLRRKAALAFQNALPVNDRKIKLSYLEEAKTYLETALNQYPESKKLDKIKENLDVITRDLNNLENSN